MDTLPPKDHLLAACRGTHRSEHPLLSWARELAELHQQQVTATGMSDGQDFELRRHQLVLQVDKWVAQQLPVSIGCARLHTETLGTVIDRLAKFTTSATAALNGATDVDLWDAWERLAELAIGYEDLKDEVSTGRRRLPSTY